MGLTYFGHPVACRAALKNIEIIEQEGLLGRAREMGGYLQAAAQDLSGMPFVGNVRGYGLMLAVDLMADPQTKKPFPISTQAGGKVFKSCVDQGVIVRPVGDKIILSPPLVISNQEIDQVLSCLRSGINDLEKG